MYTWKFVFLAVLNPVMMSSLYNYVQWHTPTAWFNPGHNYVTAIYYTDTCNIFAKISLFNFFIEVGGVWSLIKRKYLWQNAINILQLVLQKNRLIGGSIYDKRLRLKWD